MLFDKIIFGPIKSRRLGNSLGVNLLPTDSKICTFDCIYCECGFNFSKPLSHLPQRADIKKALENKLLEISNKKEQLDTITFAGNGEPTMHPEFSLIMDDVISLRDRISPTTKISVLSNATFIKKPDVFDTLQKIDNNILKLDSVLEKTVKIINQPVGNFSIEETIRNLKKFNGNLIIQTLFFKGDFNENHIDNTSEEEVCMWLKAIDDIKPKEVMIYTLDRPTPAKNLGKASVEKLQEIATRVKKLGIKTRIND